MAAKLLAELDGDMGAQTSNARVRADLQKCVAKIQRSQLQDGSWNIDGGWAPVLGTSMASQSLAIAQMKGAANSQVALDKVERYSMAPVAASPGASGGIAGGVPSMAESVMVTGRASAGVPLYQSAQELEQLSRTPEDRKKNAAQIKEISRQLANEKFVTGFGSIGGEEFFSWLNVSESLHRTGGPEWRKWNSDTTAKLLKLQNADGTWAGSHCITGRVAVTSAAILLLRADREPAPDSGAKVIPTGTRNR
jgi:hypothetical protein